jgi:hypothetical protein
MRGCLHAPNPKAPQMTALAIIREYGTRRACASGARRLAFTKARIEKSALRRNSENRPFGVDFNHWSGPGLAASGWSCQTAAPSGSAKPTEVLVISRTGGPTTSTRSAERLISLIQMEFSTDLAKSAAAADMRIKLHDPSLGTGLSRDHGPRSGHPSTPVEGMTSVGPKNLPRNLSNIGFRDVRGESDDPASRAHFRKTSINTGLFPNSCGEPKNLGSVRAGKGLPIRRSLPGQPVPLVERGGPSPGSPYI